MKIKSRVNGLIIEATSSTAEILKLGNGAYARAISDVDAEADDDKPAAAKNTTPAKKTTTKKTPTKTEVEQIKKEAKAAGIDLQDSQIEGVNQHDDDEDSVEVL